MLELIRSSIALGALESKAVPATDIRRPVGNFVRVSLKELMNRDHARNRISNFLRTCRDHLKPSVPASFGWVFYTAKT